MHRLSIYPEYSEKKAWEKIMEKLKDLFPSADLTAKRDRIEFRMTTPEAALTRGQVLGVEGVDRVDWEE